MVITLGTNIEVTDNLFPVEGLRALLALDPQPLRNSALLRSQRRLLLPEPAHDYKDANANKPASRRQTAVSLELIGVDATQFVTEKEPYEERSAQKGGHHPHRDLDGGKDGPGQGVAQHHKRATGE